MSDASHTFLEMISLLSLPSAKGPELTARWNEAVAKAKIAARPVPHGDADETTILCYMRNWRTAMVHCHRKLHIQRQLTMCRMQ